MHVTWFHTVILHCAICRRDGDKSTGAAAWSTTEDIPTEGNCAYLGCTGLHLPNKPTFDPDCSKWACQLRPAGVLMDRKFTYQSVMCWHEQGLSLARLTSM